MINQINNSGIQNIASYQSISNNKASQPQNADKKAETDTLSISQQAQQLAELEQVYSGSGLSDGQLKRVDSINAEIDKILGVDEISFSKADEKSANKLYQQIDRIFADNVVSKDEEKQLSALDSKLADIYQKYEKPLNKEQEQKLEALFSELDQIYGVEPQSVDDGSVQSLFQGLGLNAKEQQQADKINADIDKILGVDNIEFSQQDIAAADKLYQQIDDILATGNINKEQEKQLSKLDQQLDGIFQKYEKPLSKEDEKQLDQLFGQLDKLYGLS